MKNNSHRSHTIDKHPEYTKICKRIDSALRKRISRTPDKEKELLKTKIKAWRKDVKILNEAIENNTVHIPSAHAYEEELNNKCIEHGLPSIREWKSAKV